MYQATISDCYVCSNGVFYRLGDKMDLAPILHNRLNNDESRDQAIERWKSEQHWLADWNSRQPFDGYCKNCRVTFEIRSSTFYSTMRHNSDILRDVRNINAFNIKKI